ncbi:MAG: hypothetical protein Q7S15_02600 [bacterium]|nr:hypothetical protein [bacterium]
MIYFFYGDDSRRRRQKLSAVIEGMLGKKPDAVFQKIDSESWDEGRLEELIEGQGLFEQKCVVELDSLFEIGGDFISGVLARLAESRNIFFIAEGALDKKTLEKIKKHAEKVQEFPLTKKEAARDNRVFAMTDALGRRDRKSFWLLYQKYVLGGGVAEELHGLLLWQTKAMLLAQSDGATPKNTKQNPFVFKKSLEFSKNYSAAELRELSSRLVSLYHDARRGEVSFETALEKFVLSI